jgi:hypothetical protein
MVSKNEIRELEIQIFKVLKSDFFRIMRMVNLAFNSFQIRNHFLFLYV